jgi:hypothetical protein
MVKILKYVFDLELFITPIYPWTPLILFKNITITVLECTAVVPGLPRPKFACTPCSGDYIFCILQFKVSVVKTVLWIRIGFNADPDPAFCLDADPDPESQTNADPCGPGSWSDFKATKTWTFTCKIYAFLQGRKEVYLLILVNFNAPETDPDLHYHSQYGPGKPNQCGSMRIVR